MIYTRQEKLNQNRDSCVYLGSRRIHPSKRTQGSRLRIHAGDKQIPGPYDCSHVCRQPGDLSSSPHSKNHPRAKNSISSSRGSCAVGSISEIPLGTRADQTQSQHIHRSLNPCQRSSRPRSVEPRRLAIQDVQAPPEGKRVGASTGLYTANRYEPAHGFRAANERVRGYSMLLLFVPYPNSLCMRTAIVCGTPAIAHNV